MGRRNQALAVLAFVLALAFAAGACSGSVANRAKGDSQTVTADDGGEEEILDADNESIDDDVGRPEDESVEGKSGTLLVSVTYLAMSLGAAALPFLTLL